MENPEFDQEAVPQHVEHHLRQQARDRASKIIERADLFDQIEPGMNLGAFPLGYAPCNTLR